MSVNDRTTTTEVAPTAPALAVADPAPLGLAGFALTTFLLSAANAGWMTHATGNSWLGYAFAYGGFGQLLAGMWEFRNRNVFGATAFSTYGGFWLGFGAFVVLAETTGFLASYKPNDLANAGAWFLVAFAIFNTYMLIASLRNSVAVFLVFLTLEITEILLAIGNFNSAHTNGHHLWWVHAGGWAGVVTAAFAWYASAAGVMNGQAGRRVWPVGAALMR